MVHEGSNVYNCNRRISATEQELGNRLQTEKRIITGPFRSTARMLRPKRSIVAIKFSIAQYNGRRQTKCLRLVFEPDSTLALDILFILLDFL